MRIPFASNQKSSRSMIDTFGGYDRREDAGEGSFSDMKNMTGKSFPCISTRDKRARIDVGDATVFDIKALDIYHNGKIRKNALVADCKNRLRAFYKDGDTFTFHDIYNTGSVLMQKRKRSVVSGTKLYFFPDNMCYDLMNNEASALEYKTQYELGVGEDGCLYCFSFEPCDINGNEAEESSPYRRLRRTCYKMNNGVAEDEPYKYIMFSRSVKEGDTIHIFGAQDAEVNGYYNVVTFCSDSLSIVVESNKTFSQSEGTIYLQRELPEMDFVISAKNRLWGCRYGTDKYGNCVNEIYASALGDGSNWYKFLGVSTDSWTASVGCSGAFTGAVTIDGNPVFFKEDYIIKVFGDYPSEFTVSETCSRGIESGSEDSAVFVHDALYYKTYSGIVRYDGGLPVNVDAALGKEKYKNAVAGTIDDRYFVSMENEIGKRELFVYDTVRRLWHKEDDLNVVSFARAGGDLYFLSSEEDKSSVFCVCEKEDHESESDFEWMCESAQMGYNSPDRKYVASLGIRLECGDSTATEVFIQYDNDGVWHSVGSVSGKSGSVLFRVRPRRCDSFRLRFEGTGECTLRSVTKTEKKSSPLSGTRG